MKIILWIISIIVFISSIWVIVYAVKFLEGEWWFYAFMFTVLCVAGSSFAYFASGLANYLTYNEF